MNKVILTLLLGAGMINFSMSQCYGPEPFDDINDSGSWTANESYTDINGNGQFDNSIEVDCEAEFKIDAITDNGDGTYDLAVVFKSTTAMYGYQLDFLSNETGLGFANNLLSAVPSGGDLTNSGLFVQGNGGTIIAVSFSGLAIPAAPDWSPLTVLTATPVNGSDDVGTSVILNAHNDGTSDGTSFVVSGAGGTPLLAEWYDQIWTIGNDFDSETLDNDVVSPYSYSLKDNYPNPFNPTTIIEYSIAEISDVNISIYDATGRFVKNLVSKQHVPGDDYQVSWDGTNESGTNVAAGMYFYKINAGSFVETKKMLLVK